MYVDLGYVDDLDDFNEPAENLDDGQWLEFDQTEFIGIGYENIEFEETNWDETGKVYIPNSCYTETCRVHVAFHGCTSSAEGLE